MTDLQYALPLMRENVERNANDIQCPIECKECDWFSPASIDELFGNADGLPDMILVADCVWLPSLIVPLLQTLKVYTTHSHTKVLVTYQQRGREAHEELMEGIHDLFEVISVDTEKSAGLAKPDVFHVFECSKKVAASMQSSAFGLI
jgi:hypothetical protein